MANELERRCTAVEVRAETDGEIKRLEGYPVVFGELSEDLGGFREIIEETAFVEALRAGQDVRALFNHDPNQVLGRTTNSTLALSQDMRGLRMSVLLPDTGYAQDVYKLVQRGDVNQMSFAFRVKKGGESWATENGIRVRRVQRADLFDVSVVTYPAYQATTVAARTLEAARNESDGQEAGEIEQRDGDGRAAVVGVLREQIDILRRKL